jgi:hypothetical protein
MSASFFLIELHAGERLAELLAVVAVLAGAEPAVFGRTHDTPGNAVAGAVEAAEGAFETRDAGKDRVFAHFDAVRHDLAGDRGAQRQLPADTVVDAEVDLGMTGDAYFLQARLNISLPGLEPELARSIVDEAHQTCPYSKATRGNINVVMTVV